MVLSYRVAKNKYFLHLHQRAASDTVDKYIIEIQESCVFHRSEETKSFPGFHDREFRKRCRLD